MINEIVNWIKTYTLSANLTSLIIGISGGIDSAVVSTLCALTGLKTIVISLPIRQKEDQLSRAKNHANWLKEKFDNVIFIEKDLTHIFNTFEENFNDNEKDQLSLANSKSRLRMITLYQIACVNKGLVVGTGNKIEDFGVGFFTKYGDGGVDISPIADFTKTEVRKLAFELGISEEIIIAKPTDGLWDDDKTDEEQLGASYEELEWAMDFLNSSKHHNKEHLTQRETQVLKIYQKFNAVNKHKMINIPIYKKKI